MRLEPFDKAQGKAQGGQTLVEVLVALGVAVAIITAITAVVIAALDNAQFSKNQNLANSFAQEGMEVVRGIKDRSWNEFFTHQGHPGPNHCLPQNSTQLVSRSGPHCEDEGDIFVGGTKFIRAIRIKNNDSDCSPPGFPLESSKVTVEVSWSDGRCPSNQPQKFCHSARFISCFVQLNTVGAP